MQKNYVIGFLRIGEKRELITPPPNNLKNQQAYLTLGC